jgi:hypothetical protein
MGLKKNEDRTAKKEVDFMIDATSPSPSPSSSFFSLLDF